MKTTSMTLALSLVATLVCASAWAAPEPSDLRCEYLVNPLGIDSAKPRLSWVLESHRRGEKQTAYHVLVATSPDLLTEEKGDLWDSGKVVSEQSIHVPYAGKALTSGLRCYWQVRAWGVEDKPSGWSEPAFWTMGILKPEEWKGQWIGYPYDQAPVNPEPADGMSFEGCHWIWFSEGDAAQSAPGGHRFFRKTITIPEDRTPVRGRILIAADNYSHIIVNGVRAGRFGEWESGSVFEFSDVLRGGENLIALNGRNENEGPAGVIAKVQIDFESGDPMVIVTDGAWKASDKPDAGWDTLDFDDAPWQAAKDVGAVGRAPWGTPRVLRTGPTQTVAAPLLRKDFMTKGPVKSAVASVCGLGYYELYLNGEKVGDHVLDPTFTRYDKRALYVTYDVTEEIKKGANVLGAMLGNGWYNMHTRATWDFDGSPWRATPRMLLQLRLDYEDGTSETVVSDGSWKATTGPLQFDSIRNGEIYDARKEKQGWGIPFYNDSDWLSAQVVEAPKGVLKAQQNQPMKVTREIEPKSVEEIAPGIYRFDMGQNFAGWVQLRVAGSAGLQVKLRYRELLNEDGTLDQRNTVYLYSGEFQTDTYILNGHGVEVWNPRFTYHGFRYVDIEGFPGTPTLASLRGQVVHSAFESTGTFECSNTLLNDIQRNTLWSYISNFAGYPTDCPQREKNGWTGDAHLAAEMGLMNFRAESCYARWMNDFADEQRPNGEYSAIMPTSGWGYNIGPSWDCAYVLIPWYLYQYRGDTRILEDHYDGIRRYVEFLGTRAQDYIVDYGLGDWCPPEGGSQGHKCPRALTSTGYYYADTVILSKMAALLGNQADAQKYTAQAQNIKTAFNARFYTPDTGAYAGENQTSMACALYQGLVEPQETPKVVARLLKEIEARDGHLDCGILGTKYLLHALSDNERSDVAYGVTTKTTFPSWGHWLEQGATTLWEQWGGGGSHNHIMFGDISAWCYKVLAGIGLDPANPGFKHIIIRPRLVGDLMWARADHRCMYGTIRSAWKIEDGAFTLDIAIPTNTTAAVYVPAAKPEEILGGKKPILGAEGVTFLRMEGDAAVFEVGSGRYRFMAPTDKGKQEEAPEEEEAEES